jgi:predicted SAM-dependent methyltransferase
MNKKLGPDHPDGIRRVQVGCGPHNLLPDWWNVDIRMFRGVDQVLDATEPWPWGDLEFVYGEHFLEHLELDKALDFLCHAGNALRPGGILRLTTPNLEWVIHSHFTPGPVDQPTRVHDTLRFNRAFYGWGHRFLYTREMLVHVLTAIGFEPPAFFGYGESDMEELRDLERHGGYSVNAGLPSLLVAQASRPHADLAVPAQLRENLEENFLKHVRAGH